MKKKTLFFEKMNKEDRMDVRKTSKESADNTFIKFLKESPMYQEFAIDKNNIQDIIDVMDGNVKIELYCPECQTTRVFSIDTIYSRYHPNILFPENPLGQTVKNSMVINRDDDKFDILGSYDSFMSCRVVDFPFYCSMDKKHIIDYVVRFSSDKAIKIGQFPTYATLKKYEFSKYKKIIPDGYDIELSKAIGLASDDIGIGSFVYLRRVLEKLVFDAGQDAINNGDITQNEWDYEEKVDNYGDKKQYRRSFVEKIKLIKDYLPDFIVENTSLYGIISKGIHELSEKECLKYFDVIYKSILLILNEKYEKEEKEKNKQNLISAVSAIKEQITYEPK